MGIIIIHSMDRLAKNLDDLRKLVVQLTSQKFKREFNFYRRGHSYVKIIAISNGGIC